TAILARVLLYQQPGVSAFDVFRSVHDRTELARACRDTKLRMQRMSRAFAFTVIGVLLYGSTPTAAQDAGPPSPGPDLPPSAAPAAPSTTHTPIAPPAPGAPPAKVEHAKEQARQAEMTPIVPSPTEPTRPA